VIGPAFSLLAFSPAAVISVRERRHRPVAASLFISLVHACVTEADASERVRGCGVVLVAGASCYASLAIWEPRLRLLSAVWLLSAGAVLAGLLDERWGAVALAPSACAVAVGAVAWWRAGMNANGAAEWTAAALLVSDATALLFGPDAIAYQGRVQAALIAALQIAFIARSRRAA